jgi:tol-pal system protein YbgF
MGAAAQESLDVRLQRLERRVAVISDLVLQVEGLKRSNRELLGRVETLEYRLQKLERKQRELYLDLDQRIGALQGGTPSAGQPSTEAGTEKAKASPAPVPKSSGKPANPREVRKAYDAAYALLQPPKRDYQKAIAAFSKFLERYPRNEFTDNALYWLGETYYVTGDNQSALARFDELLQQFPASEKAPGALLKKGYILQAMGRKKEARAVFQKLVQQYPDASVARMARSRLKQLK